MAKKKGKKGKTSGPAQSPSIFAAKWLEKFCTLERLGNHSPIFANTPSWYIQRCEHLFTHLFHFHVQATELQLTASDFPDNEANPFAHASEWQLLVDMLLQWMKDVKHGGTHDGKVEKGSWSVFPLVVRNRVNNLVERVEKATKDGWWEVTEESRQDFLEQVQQDEEEDK